MRTGIAATPQWFVDALAVHVDIGHVIVDGVRIAYRAWGREGKPGIVLVHGGMAHSRWWDHIAPQLAQERRVVALDLSGHGDSGHRDTYGVETWAQEILAVATDAGMAGLPVLVGHSMGGIVSFAAARLHRDSLVGVILLDSPIQDVTLAEQLRSQGAPTSTQRRTYPTAREALDRFRLVPAQDSAEPYVLDHIARQSMRQGPDGWCWKFDTLRVAPERSIEAAAKCRVAYFRSEHGVVTPELLAHIRRQLGPDALVTELPAAGHHPMIDQPLAVVAVVRAVLEAWGLP